MKISKKEFTKLIKEELKDALEEHEDCEETEEEQPEEEERIKTPRKSKIDPVTGKLLPLPWRLLNKGLSKIGLEEKQALRQIVAEETALVYREELLQEEALIMETQLQILTELRDEGVITEEQLQEIFRALGKAASAMKGRVKGAVGAAGAVGRGLRAKAAGALAGKGTAGGAGSAEDAAGAFGSAKEIYSMTKKLSVLQDHRKKLVHAMEDIQDVFKKIGMEAPEAANSVKQRFGQMVRSVTTGIKQLDQGLEELTTAVEAAKSPAQAKAPKELPAGTPAPVSA